MQTISSLTAVALLSALTVSGQSTATAASGSSSTLTTSAASASGSGTYIPVFEAGTTTLGVSAYAGSIVGVDASATTIAIACVDESVCDSETMTLTQGPSTWIISYTTQAAEDGLTETVGINENCKIVSSTESAVCTVTGVVKAEYDGESTSSTVTATSTFSGSEIYYDQLLITAGASKLSSPQATQTSTGAAGMVAAPLPTGNIGMGVGGMAAAAVVALAGML